MTRSTQVASRFHARAGKKRTRVSLTPDGWAPLEDRVLPAEISLIDGVLGVSASAGESNDLTVQLSLIRRLPWVIVMEAGPGVSLTVAGDGLREFRPGAVGAPLAAVEAIDLATGNEEDSGAEVDSVAISLHPSLPPSITVTGGSGTDLLTLSGTFGNDSLALERQRNAEGFKVVHASYADQSLNFLDFEQMTVDFSQDGADEVALDRYIAGLDRPLQLVLIGGGAGTDSLEVVSPGAVPQRVEVADGSLSVVDDVPGEEVFLGRSDNIAIQQPLVTIEVIDESRPEDEQSLGPSLLNTPLLDTGATGLLVVDFAARELELNGIVDDGDYLEQGVAGFTLMDVSAPYRFDFAGRSGVRNTIQDARLLYNSSLSFSPFGPFGIIGMPVMVDRVVELDMTGWSDVQDAEDLAIGVEFMEEIPDDLGHARSVPLRLVDFPHDGQVDDGPLPTFAPLPLLTVEARDDGNTATGEFLLDTGAQLSLITTDLAIALGLDENGNGTLVDEALDFIEVGGIGGTTQIPMVAFDQAAVPTTEGPELVWTELLVGVLDIEIPDGPSFDGVFGMDFLTSGWAAKILPPLLGLPGAEEDGYFSHVYFDFRQATDRLGTMIFNVTPERDIVTGSPPLPLTVAHSGFDSIAVSTGSGDDRFVVTPSASTTLVLDAGGPQDVDWLRLLPDGLQVSDDGSTITIPGFEPIRHNGFERILVGSETGLPAEGGFETPEAGPGGQPGSWLSPLPGASPWTFTPESDSAHSGVSANGTDYTSSNPDAPQGDQVAFIQGAGVISQQMRVDRDGTYRLSFTAAQRGNSPDGDGHDFALTIDGVEVAQFSPADPTYQVFEVIIDLQAGPRTIAFVGLNTPGGDRASLLDEVLLEFVDSLSGGFSGFGGFAAIAPSRPAVPVPFGMRWRDAFPNRDQVVLSSIPVSMTPPSAPAPAAGPGRSSPSLNIPRSGRVAFPTLIDRPSVDRADPAPARSIAGPSASRAAPPTIAMHRAQPNQEDEPRGRAGLPDLDDQDHPSDIESLADRLRVIRR